MVVQARQRFTRQRPLPPPPLRRSSACRLFIVDSRRASVRSRALQKSAFCRPPTRETALAVDVSGSRNTATGGFPACHSRPPAPFEGGDRIRASRGTFPGVVASCPPVYPAGQRTPSTLSNIGRRLSCASRTARKKGWEMIVAARFHALCPDKSLVLLVRRHHEGIRVQFSPLSPGGIQQGCGGQFLAGSGPLTARPSTGSQTLCVSRSHMMATPLYRP